MSDETPLTHRISPNNILDETNDMTNDDQGLSFYLFSVKLCNGSTPEPDKESVHVRLWFGTPVYYSNRRGSTSTSRGWFPWHREIRLSQRPQK